jgi:hypothetical protein
MMDDRTLIQIRERSFLDLLDLALLVIRDRPLSVGLAALAGIAPFAALNLWLLSDPEFPRVDWVALLIMETPWATAPLTLVLGELMFHERADLRRIARTLVVCLPWMVLTQLILRGLLLATVVFYPLLAPGRLAFLDEVILLERGRGLQTVRRSSQLARAFEGEMVIRWIVQVALGLAFSLCFWMAAESLASALLGNELTWYQPGLSDLSGVLFQVAVWIAIAYFGVFRFLAYLDRRIRLEGWELQLRLSAAAKALEEKSN